MIPLDDFKTLLEIIAIVVGLLAAIFVFLQVSPTLQLTLNQSDRNSRLGDVSKLVEFLS
jgi:hypothetical protein